MRNRVDNPAAERARKLFANMLELRLQLRQEGYAAADLRSDGLRRELMDIIERRTDLRREPSHSPRFGASPPASVTALPLAH